MYKFKELQILQIYITYLLTKKLKYVSLKFYRSMTKIHKFSLDY